jgi:catalase
MNTTFKQEEQDLAQQIFETMLKVPGMTEGHRPVHAKGLVCEGTFAPSREAKAISKAELWGNEQTPVIVRFSEGSPVPTVSDVSPEAGPRGMAIRFHLHGGEMLDLVLMSHNGFVVSNGEEFLALQKAIVATDPTRPHPWPIEEFVSSHPLALKFVQENAVIPRSFATESFFSNNSFVFVNEAGVRQTARYKILPVAGSAHFSGEEAKSKPANFLMEELKNRLSDGPVEFRLVLQLPMPGDPTNDPTAVWPEDRRIVEMGTIQITSVLPDSQAVQQALGFDPTHLIDGIELSDDPMTALRSRVYALSREHRHQPEAAAHELSHSR